MDYVYHIRLLWAADVPIGLVRATMMVEFGMRFSDESIALMFAKFDSEAERINFNQLTRAFAL